ncbi:CPBP family intramembrane glutamic endopeptidase [Micrococcus porci]|uniref:CPBP family intramembrane glutamic endopeptidase n=1 Tax=Micrococcus porci TaxID=2856555 RepID=UPI003CE68758
MSVPPPGPHDAGALPPPGSAAPASAAGGAPEGWPPAGWPGRASAGGAPQGWPPSGWPGRTAAARTAPSWEPGRLHWGDAAVVVLYVLMMVVGLGYLLAVLLGLAPRDPAAMDVMDGFRVNLVSYAVLVVAVLAVSWRPLVASLRVFATHTWLKILLLPALWLGTVLVNALLLSLLGQAQTSANQAALEEMTTQAPALGMVLMTVVGAPIVEEYLFRHLLVGKLSRWINVWVCAAISVAAFTLLHFLGTGGDFQWVETVPYLTLAVTITVTYVLIGRSFGYAVLLHMVNNGIAIAMLYLVAPLLPSAPAPVGPGALLSPLLALLR